MPILEELQTIRRASHGHGTPSHFRRQTINISEEDKRRMSMGYDQFVFNGLQGQELEDSAYLPDDVHIVQAKQPKIVGGIVFTSEFHEIMHTLTESRFFTFFILFIILLNTMMLVAQTWQIVLVRATWYFTAIDNVFLGIYLTEIILKLYVWRSKFFSEGWNILDLTIVVFNLVDFLVNLVLQNVGGFNGAAIFRLLRIFRAVKAIRALRVLRTIRFLANLQVIMATLLQSIKSIGAIVILMSLFVYMFAVIGRGLYADVDEERFGSLWITIFTLFQLLTLDDWFEIYNTNNERGRGHILLYLFLYIVVEYFIFLNLFVAVLVDNFQLTLEAANETRKKKSLEDSDDEDELYAPSVSSAGSVESRESDEQRERKVLEEHFPSVSDQKRETLREYFRVLTSLEYNSMILAKQQRILDMMVDMCADTNDDL